MNLHNLQNQLKQYILSGGACVPVDSKNVLDSKKQSFFSKEIWEVIRKISNNPKNFQIFGSQLYRAQPFPFDIDGIEITNFKDKKYTAKEFSVIASYLIQDLIKHINTQKGIYYGDIKIGSSYLFEIFIKIFDPYPKVNEDMSYTTDKRFNPVIFQQNIDKLFAERYLTQDVYDKMNSILSLDYISIYDYAELGELIRKTNILRWTPKDLIKGELLLTPIEPIEKGKKKKPIMNKISLADSLFYGYVYNSKHYVSSAKIDVISLINNSFVELSNAQVYYFIDKNTEKKELFTRLLGPQTLLYEMAHYYYRILKNKYDDPFKYAKRVFSYAKTKNDEKTCTTLSELFHSDVGRLSNITTELSVIIYMLENLKKPPIEQMREQLDRLRMKLAIIVNFNFNIDDLNRRINKITEGNIQSYKSIELLVKLNKYLKELIKAKALEYLIDNNLWPCKYVSPKNLIIYIR